MAVARYLVDKSALARWERPPMRLALAPLIEHGLVATCGIIEFEMLYSARDKADYRTIKADRRAAYEWLPTEDVDVRRALEVQEALAARGQLRAVSLPDLIIAAIAERHRVCVLHYDADYELLADVTGQPTLWAVPQGSLP